MREALISKATETKPPEVVPVAPPEPWFDISSAQTPAGAVNTKDGRVDRDEGS
jgi:hypothetical protein